MLGEGSGTAAEKAQSPAQRKGGKTQPLRKKQQMLSCHRTQIKLDLKNEQVT